MNKLADYIYDVLALEFGFTNGAFFIVGMCAARMPGGLVDANVFTVRVDDDAYVVDCYGNKIDDPNGTYKMKPPPPNSRIIRERRHYFAAITVPDSVLEQVDDAF